MKEFFIASSLEKIFPNSRDIAELERLSMLKNERKAFQLVFSAKKGDSISFDVESALFEYMNFSVVKMIKGGYVKDKNADDYYIEEPHEYYPDLLVPMNGTCFTALEDGLNCVWVQIVGDTLPAGNHNICIKYGDEECSIEVRVIDAQLPKQSLIYTNWFHTDCLMSVYGFEAFSDEYWETVEKFLHHAADYGMNCVLTPLFTPPLDTKVGGERPTVQLVDVKVVGKNEYSFAFDKLDKWLEMCDRCNIEYYEMSHLFTQWGARHAPKIIAEKNGVKKRIFGWRTRACGKRYRLFIEQFAKAITKYIDEKGIRERCLFHVSDEPAASMKRAYSKASKIVRDNFKGFKIIDALSSFDFYKNGLIEQPIPANDHIEPFIGNVPELWTYYCCAQGSKYVSNRFFAMPSERNRVLGLQLYKFNVKGFLHWGYNFYYTQYSKAIINPFEVSDAGGKFQSGDSFVVYPGENREPLDSLRLHVFYDAFQDMLALQLLESKIGYEKTLALVEQGLEKPLSFTEYPHDARWLENVRERVNAAIAES